MVQLIKEKKNGTIKGRTCVNGSRQRQYTPEDEASSPIVSIEGLYPTAAIDTAESRYVAICNIAGASLKADMDGQVIIILQDHEVDDLINANKKYGQYVHNCKNGRRIVS